MENFCRNCGSRLVPNTKFCTSCGTSLERTIQGTSPNNSAFTSSQPSGAYSPNTAGVRRNKKRLIILVVVSLLLILLGVQNMSLNIVGKTVTAKITNATQDTRSRGSGKPDPNRYNVKYEFLVNGERYVGSTTQTFPKGLLSTQTIQVRYMPFWPGINAPASDTKIMGGVILAGLGVLLLVLGAKGKISIG